MGLKMKLFTGLEYIMIDVANNYGLDKLSFEERLKWFKETVTINKDSTNQDILEFANTAQEAPALVFAGLQAYRDTLNNKPTGYRIGLDAIASGTQFLSALMADEKGLDATGLISDRRADVYTEIYEQFKIIFGEDSNKSRKDCKNAIMPFFYGSEKRPKDYFGSSQEELDAFYEACNNVCSGAMQLRDVWVECWNPNNSRHEFVLPDGFTVQLKNIIQKQYTVEVNGNLLPFKIKTEGKSKSSVSNCANATHSLDSMLCRELVRRCMFDLGHYQYLSYLCNANEDLLYLPDEKLPQKELDKLGMLGELIELYEEFNFFSIRIANYIKSLDDLLKLSKRHRVKLAKVIDLMIEQGTFDISTVHDCFFVHPNNGNYIRYWYKEIMADLIESNCLTLITEQLLPNTFAFNIDKQHNHKIAELVRNSNYGIC